MFILKAETAFRILTHPLFWANNDSLSLPYQTVRLCCVPGSNLQRSFRHPHKVFDIILTIRQSGEHIKICHPLE